MSAEITDISDPVLTCQLRGKVTYAEFSAMQKKAAELIQKRSSCRILVLLENFLGLEKAGEWGDVSFQAENDPFIGKIAIIGDPKWEDVALLFTAKGIRRVPIEFFTKEDLAKARKWLVT